MVTLTSALLRQSSRVDLESDTGPPPVGCVWVAVRVGARSRTRKDWMPMALSGRRDLWLVGPRRTHGQSLRWVQKPCTQYGPEEKICTGLRSCSRLDIAITTGFQLVRGDGMEGMRRGWNEGDEVSVGVKGRQL